MAQLMAIAKIRTSHGVKGEVKLLSYSGEYEHFTQLSQVVLKKDRIEKTAQVEGFRLLGELPLMKFVGVDSPEAAKAYAGFEVWVDRELAAPLEKGEYYLSDLIGCSLVSDQTEYGVVASNLEGGHGVLLEIRRKDGSTFIVPFLSEYLGDIDLAGRRIELKTPWLAE